MRIVIRRLCSCIRTYASCFVCSTIPSTVWRIRPDSWNHIVLVGASWGMHWIWALRKWDESYMPSLVTVSSSVDGPTQRAPCKIARIQFNNGVQSFFTFGNQWSFFKSPLMGMTEFSIRLKSPSFGWLASESLENKLLTYCSSIRILLCSSQTWPRCLNASSHHDYPINKH